MKLRQQYVDGEWIVWIVNNEGEEECSPYCSQGSLPIEEEPCEVCRRKEE